VVLLIATASIMLGTRDPDRMRDTIDPDTPTFRAKALALILFSLSHTESCIVTPSILWSARWSSLRLRVL
jgi:hypothetical protein